MKINALTIQSDKLENAIVSPISVCKPATSNETYFDTKAIWDTGATHSVITESMAKKIGLVSITKAPVIGIHGTQDANVYFVHVILNNKEIALDLRVTECSELSSDSSIGMLIGMDVITKGDFSISNCNGVTTRTFRVPALERIDFVDEIKTFNEIKKRHELNTTHNITDKCPCGSGKLYKNCHGLSIYNK